jgi:2',3'-cyclic-nucleotide 2'-phosphodiesterase (5'-nucleotidase family)
MKLLVANEGEALSANGSISIIDLSGGAAAAFVSNTIGFSSLNGAEAVLRDRGVQVIPGQPAAGDIEPEYITISADGTRAYVTLQEVNSVAVIDLTNPTADRPIAIQALGTVNFNVPGNAIDPSDQDGPPVPPSATGTASINIRNVPVQGLLQPDAIATFDVAGVTYFVTANEGDSRVNVTDLVRFNSNGYVLDPTAFPNAAALKAAANLGRLNVSNNVGDTDGDGDIDVIHTIGGRGISIFRQNADGTITKVRETGGEFEAITAQLVPGSFNSNQSVTGFDGRSDDKGPEPEGVTIGVIGGRTYAFVGLERVGGYMVYDVTDPANASFVSYKPQTAQDLGPETSAFVSAANSPTGQALLLSGQEISNSVTLYSIQTQTEGDDTIKGGADGETWNGRGGNDSIAGNGGNDNITGGAGTDTAVFRGVRAGYLVTNNGTVVTDINLVDGDDGTDTLSTVEFLAFSDQTVSTQSFVTYQLQLLHLSDGEAGLLAPTTAPLLAALFDRFEDQVANSITIAGGDTYIPGPFLAGGTDPSLSPVLNAVAGTTFAAGALAPIAAVDTAIHNIIGVEVSGIGNHEWDLGSNVYQASITPGTSSTNPGWVGANYVSLTANLNFNPGGGIPADAINGRFTNTPAQAGLEEASSLKGRVAPSAVVTEGGEKIGFVGVTTQVLEAISSPTGAEVIGFPFGPGPNGEVDNMALLAQQLQPVIDDLRNQGVNKIVLLSHLQLLNNEKTLAPLLEGVDIILAAGSNTRLGDANDTAVAFPGHAATFADTYPLVLNDADGKTTLIVNTDNEYTYLGRLVVDFDGNGDIILSSLAANTAINGAYAATVDNVAAAYGVNAADVYTSDAFAAGSKGARVKALTDAVNTVIQVKDGNVFGYSDVYLEGDRTAVRTEESNLGNVTADANADALRDALGLGVSDPVISIKNGGGIRAQIGSLVNNPDGTVTKVGPGSVSQLDVENSLRFDNALMVFDTTAQGLKAILEHSVSQTAPGATPGRFGQIGGISFSFNPTAAVGSRVSDIAIINEDNQIIATLYDNGVLQAGVPTVIKAVTLNFLANGGDGYPIKANGENFRYLLNDGTLGPILDEALNFESARPDNALGEIRALQEYFGERYATPATAFNQADTPASGDLRVQNTGARSDTVLFANYFLNGNGLGNTVVGNNGDNVLQGFGGNDVMIGGAGADRIIGGDGFDTASFATASAGVVVDLSTGRGSGGDAAGDRYEGIEALLGSGFDDIFTGSRTSDTLDGAGGNDVVIAARGADTLIGGAGNDVLIGGLDADSFMFGSVDNGSVDYIVDFLRGEGDTLVFGPGVTVLAASVGFVTTPASVNGQDLANSSRALDLVLTLGSAAGTQTVHVLDAYSFASNDYWEGVLGLELSYPRPLPVGAELLPIA